MDRTSASTLRMRVVLGLALACSAVSGAHAAGRPTPAPQAEANHLLVPAQDIRITGRPVQRQAMPPDPYGQPGHPPPYGYPPQPYGPWGQPPRQQAASPPCPDIGSTAVVERARPQRAPRGPLVAMPTNDCADLPGNNAVQPFIGVDVQITPPGFEQQPPVRPTPRRPGG
jgi:hypothetical protein